MVLLYCMLTEMMSAVPLTSLSVDTFTIVSLVYQYVYLMFLKFTSTGLFILVVSLHILVQVMVGPHLQRIHLLHMMQGTEWVERFVKEMMSASNIDDAKARASRALEALEKSICARAKEENIMLKQQVETLLQETAILKRAFAIQRERQKEFEDRGNEVNNLKQMVAQYQEQLRTLEVNNYALTMHLKQAQQGNSIPRRFHPDVF